MALCTSCLDWIIQCVPHTNKFCYCLINHVDRFVEATLYNRYWFSIKPAPELPALPRLSFSIKWPLMVKILTNRSNTTCFEMISQIHVCSIYKTNTQCWEYKKISYKKFQSTKSYFFLQTIEDLKVNLLFSLTFEDLSHIIYVV